MKHEQFLGPEYTWHIRTFGRRENLSLTTEVSSTEELDIDSTVFLEMLFEN